MASATVTSKGQITIPKVIRDRLGVGVGDRVVFVPRPDGSITIEPATGDLADLAGMVKPARRGVSIGAMARAVRTRAAGR